MRVLISILCAIAMIASSFRNASDGDDSNQQQQLLQQGDYEEAAADLQEEV